MIKSLLCTDVVNQPGFARDGIYTDLDQISLHLVAGYERVRKQNAVGLRVFFWNTDVGLSWHMNCSDLRNGKNRTAAVELGRNG